MNCSEVRDLLSAYYDGELDDDEQAQAGEHLEGCSECRAKLGGYEKLSAMAHALPALTPPDRVWSHLERQLDAEAAEQTAVAQQEKIPHISRTFGLAIALLVTAGIAWIAYQATFPTHADDAEFVAQFDRYLDEFRRDPRAAQQMLVTRYRGQAVNAEEASRQLGYRPTVMRGLPEEYTVESTVVMKMPCCTCVQCVCKRKSGGTIAIFEHDDPEPKWFGDRPRITANCGGTDCQLVELNNEIAASWKHGRRHITVIGLQDLNEVSTLVGWFEKKRPS